MKNEIKCLLFMGCCILFIGIVLPLAFGIGYNILNFLMPLSQFNI